MPFRKASSLASWNGAKTSLAKGASGSSTPRTSRLRTLLERERLLVSAWRAVTMYLPLPAQSPFPRMTLLPSWPVLRRGNLGRMGSRVGSILLWLRFLPPRRQTTLMMPILCAEAGVHGDRLEPRRRMTISLLSPTVESHLWCVVSCCRHRPLRLHPKTIITLR